MPETISYESLGANVSYDDLAAEEGNSYDLSEVPMTALTNLPQSAAQFGSDMVQPILHPVDTAQALGNVLLGTVQKAIPGEQSSEPYADAVGQFFSERYGGWESLKRTMAEDPVGFLADAATILTGGSAAVGRAPGAAGKIGQAVQKAGGAVDPTSLATKAGGAAADIIGRVGTHTGGDSVKTAYRSGVEGGEAGAAFRDSIRGATPVRSVVDEARDAVTQLRAKRSDDYKARMDRLGKSPEIVDFNKIKTALSRVDDQAARKGRTTKKLGKVQQVVRSILDEWEGLGPDMHGPHELDLLKQDLWDVQSKYMGKRDSRYNYVNRVRRAVKKAIEDAAPQYGTMMKDYGRASEVINEIESTLSLNPTARVDTALRKLQSIMRNNANTNYGYRVTLGEILADNGATHLMEKLAGQSMETLTPRGLGPLAAMMTGVGAYGVNPALWAALPFQSPRLVG